MCIWTLLFVLTSIISIWKCDADLQFYDLSEGDPCIDFENRNGTCVRFNKCLSAAWLRARSKSPVICSFDGEIPILCCSDCDTDIDICSFDGEIPILCCSDCDTDIDVSNVIVGRNNGFYLRTGEKAFDKCYEYKAHLPYPCPIFNGLSRVYSTKCVLIFQTGSHAYYTTVGGMAARRAEYPHMALLGYGTDLNSTQWLCGGTIISDKFVLTAAHCIASAGLGPVKYAALGILKRSDPAELWQVYRLKKIIPHPKYRSPAKYHDIALLETATRIKFSREVLPACLNTGFASEVSAWATGWGTLGYREELADNLQTVELLKYSEDDCAAFYPEHRLLVNGYDPNTQMCYGDKDKDTCEGDSGGPLQVLTEEEECVFVVLGVTSYGRKCGQVGSSGIYTRVSHYIPWIESIVWPD